jgi:hypothetical protein
MFDVKWFDKAEDTPAGHFSMEDGSLKAPAARLVATAAKNSHSRVNMDHYNTYVGAEGMLAEQVRERKRERERERERGARGRERVKRLQFRGLVPPAFRCPVSQQLHLRTCSAHPPALHALSLSLSWSD